MRIKSKKQKNKFGFAKRGAAQFQLTYANGALAIRPLNDTASGMSLAQGTQRTILVTAGMLAAAEKNSAYRSASSPRCMSTYYN